MTQSKSEKKKTNQEKDRSFIMWGLDKAFEWQQPYLSKVSTPEFNVRLTFLVTA